MTKTYTTKDIFLILLLADPDPAIRRSLIALEALARQTVKKPILWTVRHDPGRGGTCTVRSGRYVLNLSQPTAEIAAHELAHTIVSETGCHLRDEPRPARRYAADVSALFDEPPVYRMLRSAGMKSSHAPIVVQNFVADLKRKAADPLALALRYEGARRVALAAGYQPAALGLPAIEALPAAVCAQTVMIRREMDRFDLNTPRGWKAAWYALRWNFPALTERKVKRKRKAI